MRSTHPTIKPCPDCGSEVYERTVDGIAAQFDCIDCGTFCGDLPLGAEP